MPVFLLSQEGISFPSPRLASPEGLLAVGGNLSPERLLEAYSLGIFPWYDLQSPILWWTPDPRCVLLPENLHVPRSLDKLLKKPPFVFTVDTAFRDVLMACAGSPRPGQVGTWLVPEMIEAYTRLHEIGVAHSVEAWLNGELAGGFYGLSLGSAIFGESMFYRVPNASKAAFAWFALRMRERGCRLIDCQQTTGNMLRFGAAELPRTEFMRLLRQAIKTQPLTWV